MVKCSPGGESALPPIAMTAVREGSVISLSER